MHLTRKEKFERNDTLRSQRRQEEKVDGNDSNQPQKRKRHTETLSLGHSVKVIRSDQPPINRLQSTAINRVIPPNSKSATHNRLQSKTNWMLEVQRILHRLNHSAHCLLDGVTQIIDHVAKILRV